MGEGKGVLGRKADMACGKVWLAGAGPGDAGLLTVKTKELIETVDTIVYDALIGTEILCQLPAGKELIYVGKRAGHHTAEQEEINRILLARVKEGKRVLRLKGGDPFVFGRGGEELEALAREGISFEIVPGVTSATAVPAYAGILLTHRDFVSSFHVITGHPKKDGRPRIDYPALVKLNGTLVFLMGLSKAGEICQGLMDAGMAETVPAAALERGTNAKQRKVLSDLGHLPEEIKKSGLMAPAILAVGEVCALSSRFDWAGRRMLGGRQFVVTRPREQGADLARRLRGLGAQVLEIPAIETVPIRPNRLLAERMGQFARQEGESWLVFTSPTGVRVFFGELLEQGLDLRQMFRRRAEVKFAVIGSATRDALKEYGLLADLMPSVYDGEHLGHLLARTAKAGSEIVIARAKNGSEALVPLLQAAGLRVTDLALYETKMPCHGWLLETVAKVFSAGEVDGVIFTSASTVQGFVREFLPETVTAVCIGEQTAAEARKYGMRTVVAKEASMDSLVDQICAEFGNREETVWQHIR